MNKKELKNFRDNYTPFEATNCYGQGVELAVHFDEKDDVKRMGGRWQPSSTGKGGFWWMPANKLKDDCPIECDIMGESWGGEVQDWLNNHKMIVGHYGEISQHKCIGQINASNNGEEYELQNIDKNVTWTFTFYAKERMCYVKAEHGNGVWMTDNQARSQWEAIANSNTCVRNR